MDGQDETVGHPRSETLGVCEGDRRGVERVHCPIEIRFWCDGTCHQGRIEDLSCGGVFISAGHTWPVGSSIRFRFRIPDVDGLSEHPIQGRGTVVWIEQIGFGVRFVKLAQGARDRINFFVDSTLFERGRRPAAMSF